MMTLINEAELMSLVYNCPFVWFFLIESHLLLRVQTAFEIVFKSNSFFILTDYTSLIHKFIYSCLPEYFCNM